KIDLTTELQTFNNLATNHTLCRVFYNGKKMEATIEVIDWEERNYDYELGIFK
ncbi:hypothetical protein EZS27_028734, partial [termite gut metagenome]